MRDWFKQIPDNDHPTTQGHIVFLRNNPAILEIFERTIEHMSNRPSYYSNEYYKLKKYDELHESGKITPDEHLYHRFKLALRYEHFNKLYGNDPQTQGYIRLLNDMFELRPEILRLFYTHFLRKHGFLSRLDYLEDLEVFQAEHKERSRG